MKTMWGQFLNHDITLTATSVADYKGGAIKCCPKPNHPQCMPITIPANDYHHSKYKTTCMNFVRSAPCPLCTLGPREHQNLATSFIDLSTLYGSSQEDLHRVRAYQGGLLKAGVNKCGHPTLPPSAKPAGDQCSSPHKSILCFDAGDPRVNQHPGLQTMHTLALRAHNHHAKQLYLVNPKWSDEKLFQEARRITIAQFQHIVYHEYLPILFGPSLLKYYDLEVNYGAGYTRYEPYTDPTTWNDFTIAGRFGHSQITSWYSLIGKGYNSTGTQRAGYFLRDSFFDPHLLHTCGNDALIQGLISDPANAVDPWVDSDLHDHLYRVKGEPHGSDLPAFNVQRSRDQGIASYHSYLEFCFGIKVRGWDDLAKFIPYEQLHIFKQLYKDWRDVELWPAAISERKVPDADIGPTAACIVGIQFYHLKYGDRYFYSHGYQTGSFTPRQLSSIKQVTTLSYYLCLTGDYLPAVQKYAFFPPSRYNSPKPCQQYRQLDYNLWREVY
jgi:peroxidase